MVELELRGFPGTGAENRSFHGIDVNELPDGSVSIYVINHLREESVVDKFVHSPGTGFVMHVLRVPTAPQVPHPNSVFALPERDGESAFYVTNDHFYERGWLRYFEALTRRRWGWVSYYSSRTGWRRAVSGLAGANGIVGDKTPGGKRRVYVSETFDGAVRVLEEEAEGGLREVQKVKVDMLADNLALAEGGLYVAGPARGLGFWPWIEKPEENKGPGMVVKRFGTGQLGEGFYGEGYTVAPAVEVLVMDDGRLQNASTSVVFRPYKVEEVVEKEERQGWEDEEEEEEEPVVEATGPAPVKGDLYITGLQFRGESFTPDGRVRGLMGAAGILKCVDFE